MALLITGSVVGRWLAVLAVVFLTIGPSARSQSLDSVLYSVTEQLPEGTEIGNVKDDARLKEDFTPDQMDILRFSILTPTAVGGAAIGDYFAIDEVRGTLSIRDVIDRDRADMCAFSDTCRLRLDIAVGPAEYFRVIEVAVDVLDSNDNAPEFSLDEMSLNISELSPVGSTFVLPSVLDRDGSALGVKRFEVRPDHGQFAVRWSRDLQGRVQPRLELAERLDREATGRFDLTVVAYDGGSPPSTGELLVQVHVMDSNDNPPVFGRASYETHVAEDVAMGTILLTVHADDPDLGDNGLVWYTVSDDSERQHGDQLAVTAETGDVTLISALDREKLDVYYLVVLARDLAQEGLEATSTVTIHVDDVNDNAPSIRVTVLTDSGRAEVTESAGVGTFVALVSVTDKDLGRNSDVTCGLTNPLFSLQVLQLNKYTIVTSAALDRETQDVYDLEITCRDNGYDAQTSTAMLTIYVTDDNDHDPEFAMTSEPYVVSLPEGNAIGAPITQVRATDMDEGVNADISFELTNMQSQIFAIGEKTGILSANAIFDYETDKSYQVTVVAKDHGSPARSTSVDVTVEILDINDEIPTFDQSLYTFVVLENQDPPMEVGTVKAVDKDSEPNNQIRYRLSSEGLGVNTHWLFDIDPDSGAIYTRGALNREEQSEYLLKVFADNGEDSLDADVAMVTVTVADENDNAPVIDFPARGREIVQISPQTPVGHQITQILARDADQDANALLTYFIISRDAYPGTFRINPENGVIYLDKAIDEAPEPMRFYLHVLVKDAGYPEQVTSANLTILVNESLTFWPLPLAPEDDDSASSGKVIIVAVVSVSCVLVLILLAAIGLVLLRSRARRRELREATPDGKDASEAGESDKEAEKEGADDVTGTARGLGVLDVASFLQHEAYKDMRTTQKFSLDRDYPPSYGDSAYPDKVYVSCRDSPIPDVHGATTKQVAQASPQSNASGEVDLESSSSADSGRGPSEEGESLQQTYDHGFPLVSGSAARRNTQSPDSALSQDCGPGRVPTPTTYGSQVWPQTAHPAYASFGSAPGGLCYHHQQQRYHKPTPGVPEVTGSNRQPGKLTRGTDVRRCPVHGAGIAEPPPTATNQHGDAVHSGNASVVSGNNVPRLTVRDVKARNRSKKADFISNSQLNAALPKYDQASDVTDDVTSGRCYGNPGVYRPPADEVFAANFSDANSLLKYKPKDDGTIRSPSQATDATSSTSGSYVIQPDDVSVYLDDVTNSQIVV